MTDEWCWKVLDKIDRGLIKVLSGIWSRDSSVGIATGYGLDDQGEREFESGYG
jgi:hypothetical protein